MMLILSIQINQIMKKYHLILSLILSKKIMMTYCLIFSLILSLIFSNQIMKKKVHIHCFHQTFVFWHLIMVTITLIKSVTGQKMIYLTHIGYQITFYISVINWVYIG